MTSTLQRVLSATLTLMSCAGLAIAVEPAGESSWLAPTIGPFSPSAHLNVAAGNTSGDPVELAAGHHDPTREDGTVQGLEMELSFQHERLKGFANYAVGYGAEEWKDEWEEAFVGVTDLPGGLELRGGRALARWGYRNAKHLHAWDLVDMPLVYGRFLGDDGLIFDGADITFLKKGVGTTYGLVAGFGDALEHDDHGNEDLENEHGVEGLEDEHGHEGEAPLFADLLVHGRAFVRHDPNDNASYESGLSTVVGDDEERRELVVVGGDFTAKWAPQSGALANRPLRWTTEVLVRAVETASSEVGFYSEAIVTTTPRVDVGTRVGYVEGDEAVETEERLRLSPVATLFLDDERRALLRTQYNYDDLDAGEEHSIWIQLGLNWGGAEVR